ncbi:hypothetical protein FQN54_000504 [Arachnomyces sp. PD_36]|nr:hypothetical protein FQN54_000504 [Arachnomyces sp. PD_36]
MSDTVTPSVQEARARLLDHFSNFKGERYGEGWSSLWDQGDFLPWDKGNPNPALEETLIKKRGVIRTAIEEEEEGGEKTTRRKRALVPGCGRGVDVLLLASFGYDAIGVEYSEKAVEVCRKEAEENGDKYPVRDNEVGRGEVRFLVGDFFKNDWVMAPGLELGQFDLIYDYTFFCALNPSLRPTWALRMTQLLAPSPRGNLICLEFPTTKAPSASGPPFASPPEVYMEHLSHPGEDIVYGDNGKVRMDPLREPSEKGLERVVHWQPENTHSVGKDEEGNVRDWLAIWRRRG